MGRPYVEMPNIENWNLILPAILLFSIFLVRFCNTSVPGLLHARNIQCVSRIWASLTWLWFEFCRLNLISTTAPAASKNDARFKSSQNQLKNNHLALLI